MSRIEAAAVAFLAEQARRLVQDQGQAVIAARDA